MGYQQNRWRCARCRRSFVRPRGSDAKWCNPCVTEVEAGPDAAPIQSNRLLKYGLTRDDYEAMLRHQAGVCAVCHQTPVNSGIFHIDHNHDTGQVRGLLCRRCNVGLGMFGDNPNLLMWASIYLRQRGYTGAEKRPLDAFEEHMRANVADLRKRADA